MLTVIKNEKEPKRVSRNQIPRGTVAMYALNKELWLFGDTHAISLKDGKSLPMSIMDSGGWILQPDATLIVTIV